MGSFNLAELTQQARDAGRSFQDAQESQTLAEAERARAAASGLCMSLAETIKAQIAKEAEDARVASEAAANRAEAGAEGGRRRDRLDYSRFDVLSDSEDEGRASEARSRMSTDEAFGTAHRIAGVIDDIRRGEKSPKQRGSERAAVAAERSGYPAAAAAAPAAAPAVAPAQVREPCDPERTRTRYDLDYSRFAGALDVEEEEVPECPPEDLFSEETLARLAQVEEQLENQARRNPEGEYDAALDEASLFAGEVANVVQGMRDIKEQMEAEKSRQARRAAGLPDSSPWDEDLEPVDLGEDLEDEADAPSQAPADEDEPPPLGLGAHEAEAPPAEDEREAPPAEPLSEPLSEAPPADDRAAAQARSDAAKAKDRARAKAQAQAAMAKALAKKATEAKRREAVATEAEEAVELDAMD